MGRGGRQERRGKPGFSHVNFEFRFNSNSDIGVEFKLNQRRAQQAAAVP